MIPRDPTHPHVRWERVTVRDVADPDLGIADRTSAQAVSELKRRGVGQSLSAAHEQIKREIVLEDHVGDPVAEVFVDVSAPGHPYDIEWLVRRPVRRRLLDLLRNWGDRP